MGNSPSKNDNALPNTSSSSSSSQPLSGGTDLEPDDTALSLSLSKNIKSNSNSNFKKIDEFPNPNSSSPKKIHKPSSSNLDLEIAASMAELLNGSFQKHLSSYGSSVDSEKSIPSSPVFTTNETKDADLLLSLSSSTLPLVLSTLKVDVEGLEPIVERSLESTPEPRKRLKSKPKHPDVGEQLVKKVSDSSASTGSGSSKDGVDIDGVIDRLLEVGLKKSLPNKRMKEKLPVSATEIKYILSKARSVFMSQPTLLRLSPPVKVVGDIHGQYHDLIRIFNSSGYPPFTNYLFLGDYVDRGHKSLETILLLLCYKIKYPENFFMLRGNHESANITKIYGFYDECKRRLPLISGSHKLWKCFIDVFNTLPIAATINDKIFCIHGGLSPELHDLKDIENIKRPTDIPDKGLLADLLWSDPDPLIKTFSVTNWPKNDRGVSYCFGKKHVDHFLAKFNMDLIVRGHMVVEDGYEFFNKRRFVTVFSAPNYCGEFNNYGAIMSVDKTLCCSFELLKPQ